MTYVLDYCVCSACYFAITAVFYFRQRKLPSTRNRLYGALLLLVFLSLILDFAAAAIDPVEYNVPAAIKYIVNILFLGCTQASGPLFFVYVMVLTGVYMRTSKVTRWVMMTPCMLIALFLLLSPVSEHGVFYIDSNGLYAHGSAHFLLYTVMAIYLISSIVLIMTNGKHVQKKKRVTIYLFILTTIVAMLIQSSNPTMLVNSTANALALTMMYHMLQSPNDHIDPVSNAFNRAALRQVLSDLQEQEQKYSILLFTVQSLKIINHTAGMRIGDRILAEAAKFLQKRFEKCNVVRIRSGTFVVIDTESREKITHEYLEKLHQTLPDKLQVRERDMRITISVAGIDKNDCGDIDSIMNTIDIIALSRQDDSAHILLADAEFQRQYAYHSAVEAALKYALDNDTVEVHYQPLHRADGSIGALEALCRINDPTLGSIRPDIFVTMAEQNGSIYQLGRLVLKRVLEFIQEYDVESWGLDHIGVNLSIAQCMKNGMSDYINNVVDYYGIRHSLISFEITETEAVTSMPLVKENMDNLVSSGFSFLLDDFGTGYANFDYIANLPFFCVKIDKSLLWEAMEDEDQMAMLRGICDVLRRLELDSVCEGVETEAQSNLLKELGITLQQGFLYSKALPPEKLFEYAKKHDIAMKGGDGDGLCN